MAKHKKVSPAEMRRMMELYDTYGTYAAVARKCGRCTTTVAKYIRMSVAAGMSVETEEESSNIKAPKSLTITF